MASAITDFLIRVKVQGQNLVDNLTKSVSGADKELNKASGSATKFGNAVKDMGNVVAGSVKTGVGAIDDMVGAVGSLGRGAAGIGLVATAFIALGMKAMAAADQIQDLSDATGISAGRLLNFKQSIIEAGGKAEDFEKMAAKLNQTLGEAAQGSEKARKAFKDLGINLGDANGNIRSTEELLPEILDALSNIDDPATRAATAVDLLGKAANRIDWTKVSAGRDAVKDEQIAKLAEYQGAIDKLANAIETQLITAFGKLAIAMDDPFNPNSIDTFTNALKRTMGALQPIINGVTFISDKISSIANPQRMPLLEGVTPSTAGAGRGKLGGPTAAEMTAASTVTGDLAITDAGKQAIANAKAQTDAMRQTNDLQNQYATKLNETLGMQQFSGDLARANLQIDFERDKKIADINKQIQIETNNKERDARVTAGIVAQLNDQVKIETAAADQRKIAKQDELTQLQRQKDLISDILLLNQFQTQDLQVKQLGNQNSLIGLYGDELKVKQGTMAIENERINAVMAANNRLAALGKNVTAEDDARANREITQARTVADAKIAILTDQMAKEKALRENASAGGQRALEAIARSMDPFQQAQMKVNSLWGNMTSAIDTFVDTGKFKFSDFATSIIRDLIKIELKAQASKLLGAIGGAMGGSGGILGGIASIFGFANGGNPPVGKPSIVGEKGPELFIPKTAGTIIPNNQVGSQSQQPMVNNYITNNISAIDAKSVAQLFAENRKTLLGTIQLAQKELPYGNR